MRPDRRPVGVAWWLTCIALAAFTPPSAPAEIRFENVSQKAGVLYRSPTAASAWGDFNGDGWPDLWVSNHDFELPSLFLNRQDGTFVDVARKVLVGKLRADFHGAAWADFDNDGDQDLIVLTGGGGGRTANPKYFFVNESGRLTDKAKELGVDYPWGRGRTPLWLDVDRDGKLDLVQMNRPRDEASSAILGQSKNGFDDRTGALEFRQSPRSLTEKMYGRLGRLMKFRYPSTPGEITVADEFAQLALLGDNQLGLVAYMQPSRIYGMNPGGLREITSHFDFPNIDSVQDAAIEDFNGDGQLDMYLVRAKVSGGDVVQTGVRRMQGQLRSQPQKPKTVRFRTDGEVTFWLHRAWMDPQDPDLEKRPRLLVGSKQLELTQAVLTVSPDDPAVRQAPPPLDPDRETISIHFDPKSREWTLTSTVRMISFVAASSKPIDAYETKGFKPNSGALPNVLLTKKGNNFVQQPAGLVDHYNTCYSVAAGDFDNDMDIDLFLVCAGTTENFPDVLLENDGKGKFVKVPQAGGAEGTTEGRGNQVAVADYDRDGFLDLFVTNGAGPPPFGSGPQHLFRNRGNANHWLQIDLQGVKSNRDGIGAKVVLETNGKRQVRLQGGGIHSFSQNHARIHFGMGPHDKAERLTVFWPSGVVQHLEQVRANQILVVKEPASDRGNK